jgi:hypothetical protein
MVHARSITNYALQEKGYECETRNGLFIFKRVRNQDDITRAIEECFGEERKVYAITGNQLVNLSFEELLGKLDRVDW